MLNETYFCIGAAKTGTTILARLLDQQPDVSCIWEGYLLRPRHSSSVLNPESKAWEKHGLPRERVDDWHARAVGAADSAGPVAIRQPEVFRQIVGEVFQCFGEITGTSIVGDKWPYYHEHLKVLLEAVPDGKFVYNVRDPRAVWNSGETFRKRNAGDAILDDMLAADRKIASLRDDPRLFVLRYEDLISDAAATMDRLASFIGFQFDEAALAYDPSTDVLPNRWNWVPAAKGDLDVELTEKWRYEMGPDDRERVTERCADFIEAYGYAI